MHDVACGNKVFASKAPILVLLYHDPSFVKLTGYFAAHCAKGFADRLNSFSNQVLCSGLHVFLTHHDLPNIALSH